MKIEKKYFILILFLVMGVNSLKAHPFYVSICQVNYNHETKSLEIAVKTFADDLLLGLENVGISKIYLGEEKEHPQANSFIFEYLKSKLSFNVNNKKTEFTFIGKEVENDVVWTYLEIKNVSSLENIEVQCSLLTEVLASQNNIIQVNNGNGIKNLLLSKNNTSGVLRFNE